MHNTTKYSRKKPMSTGNKILLTILFIETILLAGVIGYRLGEASTYVQPVYNFTLQVDSSTIEHKEENNPKPEKEANEQTPVEDINNEVEIDKLINESIFTNEEINYIVKTVWGEARGLSKTHQAGVVWTILNRCDDGRFGKDIIDVVTAPSQFAGYRSGNPVDPEIRDLVVDVLDRYSQEKSGIDNVGRVLPKEYLYFRGNGKVNLFSKKWNSNDVWNWSLESPYV